MTGGTEVASCNGFFMRRIVNRDVGDGSPNGQMRDEWAHAIRRDVDARYGGLVYDDGMKGSPQETSLHILVVNEPSCPAYTIFQ
jgi:hypothetical protein